VSERQGRHDDRQPQLPVALQLDVERAIDARLERRLRHLDARVRPRGGTWAAVVLNLGLVGLGVGATAITGALIHGPGAVVALVFEWTAIASIGVSFAQSVLRPTVTLPLGPADPSLTDPPPPAANSTPAAQAAPLPQGDPADRLPLTVRVKVEQIRRKAEMLLESQERFPSASRQLFVLRRIQAEYLPATIDAHHALAGDDRPVTPDGRTALRVLRDQLDLLDSKLDEIADDLQRENADRLLANERFLEDHFGRPQLGDPDLRLK
jgi:hypothetical protein